MLEQHDTRNFARKPLYRNFTSIGLILALLLIGSIISIRARAKHPRQSTTALATIVNSGSTNVPGVTITINSDGSGSMSVNGQRTAQTFTKGTFDTNALGQLLTQINDVTTIPDHGCIKSASFGTTTTITYQGKTSADLSCMSHEDSQSFQDLAALVRSIYESQTKNQNW